MRSGRPPLPRNASNSSNVAPPPYEESVPRYAHASAMPAPSAPPASAMPPASPNTPTDSYAAVHASTMAYLNDRTRHDVPSTFLQGEIPIQSDKLTHTKIIHCHDGSHIVIRDLRAHEVFTFPPERSPSNPR